MAVKGTGGDLFPFSRIGTLLKQRGHDVVLIHDIEQPFSKRFQDDMARMFGLNYVAIEPEQAGAVPLVLPPTDPSSGHRRRSLASTDDYDPSLELFEFNVIAGYCQHPETILIVHKNLHLVTEAVAEKLEIPLISIYPGPFYLTSMPILADIYRMRAEPVNRFRAEVGLPPASDWRSLLWSSDMDIALWPEWYAPPEPHWPSPLSMVGFLCDYGDESAKIPQEAEDFLADDEPPVLITHGTTLPERPGFFSASAEACRQLGLRAILVSRYEELIPDALPDSIKWFSYLPLRNLMPRMRAIIHHGGIGTSAQALAAGIPQLVLGFNYDRPDNGIRLQSLGVGQFLPASLWDSQAVARALRDLLESPAVRQRCEELSGQSNYPDAAPQACDIIEQLMADKSSHERATRKHLSSPRQEPLAREERQAGPADVGKALSSLSDERRALLALKLRKKGTPT
jgi:rhamnosyltransferase subunit B